MKIYLAADHGGFELKEEIKKYLIEKGLDIDDCGNFKKEDRDDYPDWISKAAEKVSNAQGSLGIVFGRSGAGECIVANKFKNVRAVAVFNRESAKLAREKNDANIMCLGADFVDLEEAKEFTDAFINTPFSNEERHVRRIEKIKQLED